MRYLYLVLSGMLIGFLLPDSSSAQPFTVAQADSLRLVVRASKVDTNRIGALLRLSDHYQHRTLNYVHNLDTALVLANQALVLSQQLHYDKGQQEAVFQQARAFIRQEKLANVKRMLPGVSSLLRIRLLLELGKNKLQPTYTQEANRDSALWYFKQAEKFSLHLKSPFWQQKSQLLISVAYLFKGDCQRSITWCRQVIEARQCADDPANELQARLQWAVTQHYEYKHCQNADSLSRELALSRQLGDKPREALLLLLVGYRQLFEGNIKQAEQQALKALAIQKVIGYSALNRAYHDLMSDNNYLSEWVVAANLSNAFYLIAELNDANASKELFYILETVKDIERSGQRDELDWPYFGIGNIYFELGQFAKSAAYYQQSLAVSQQKGQVVVHVALIRRLAESLLNTGQARQALKLLEDFMSQHLPLRYENKLSIAIGFGQCYAALGQNKRAEQYYLEAVAWSQKKVSFAKPQTYRYICEFYVATGQYVKAVPYLNQFATVPGNTMRPVETLKLYLMQYKVDSAQANFTSALHYYQRYTALKDSLLNETTNKQMAELDVRYQTRQKEQALLLRQKDIRLLTQQSHAQQTQRNALIGGTLLLVALLGLSYNRFRLKQRSNQLLQQQQQLIHHKNHDLQKLLTEQERLLKEIHHRVKNNLQIVMSLLNTQAASLKDQAALSAIQESQHRVQAMALIHQKLYQNEGVARIPMADYLAELVAYLQESYEFAPLIRFELAIDPIELDVTQAVPLGLIVNEAITNALKYAFPHGRSGVVQVKLHEQSQGDYDLVVADDGVGLPADFDPAQSRSLGMTLMYGFSEQLGGHLQISGQPGLRIQLRFQDEAYTVNA